jgi:hypothetical protein
MTIQSISPISHQEKWGFIFGIIIASKVIDGER